MLTLLPTGYWHLRLSAEVWAQWPTSTALSREHCFHPEWSWPLIKRYAVRHGLIHEA